jgi:hypothetical protein
MSRAMRRTAIFLFYRGTVLTTTGAWYRCSPEKYGTTYGSHSGRQKQNLYQGEGTVARISGDALLSIYLESTEVT